MTNCFCASTDCIHFPERKLWLQTMDKLFNFNFLLLTLLASAKNHIINYITYAMGFFKPNISVNLMHSGSVKPKVVLSGGKKDSAYSIISVRHYMSYV